jgi:hypothetical protein
VLFALVGLAAVTLVAGVVLGRQLLVVHLLVDVALAAYVALLVQHNKQLVDQRARRAAPRAVEAEVRPMRRRASGS